MWVLTSRRLEWYFCLRFTELHLENQIQQGFWNGRPEKTYFPIEGLKRPNYKIIGSKIDFSSLFLSPPITSSNRSTTRLQVKFWVTKPGPATLAFAAIPGCSIALRIKSVKCSHSGAKLTLPWLKPRGFLTQRLTLKCSVLTAILKPFNRGDTTNWRA